MQLSRPLMILTTLNTSRLQDHANNVYKCINKLINYYIPTILHYPRSQDNKVGNRYLPPKIFKYTILQLVRKNIDKIRAERGS